MANVTWTLGNPNRTSSTWNRSPSPTPWSGLPGDEPLYPGQVAADADLVILNTGNSSTYTVTVNVSADIARLTLSGNVTPPRTTTLVMTPGNTLTVSGNIALDPNSKIDGSGTIAVGGVIGNFGTIVPGTGGGGTLDLTGGGSIASGVLLSMDTIGTNLLQLDLAGGVTSAAPISMTSANQTLEISKGNVTINGGAQSLSGGAHIVMAGGTLTDASGVTMTSGTLTGFGTIAATTAISGVVAGIVKASGGALDLKGAVTGGPTLAIDTTAGSDLLIDGTATTAAPIAISVGSQTLEIGSAGNLTITGGAESIALGTIKLDGGSLTDSSGVTVTSGTLTGFGTIAANTALSGTAAGIVKASGGTLDLKGTVNSGPALAIDTTAGSDLLIDGTATSAAPIAISNANQTLEIGSLGALTINAAESITSGTIKLDGGSLTDTAGLTIGASASLTGFGTITTGATGSTDFESTGTVTATGGALEFKTATNQGAAGTAYHITDAPGSILRFDGAVGTGGITPTVTFDSSGTDLGTLDLSKTTLGNFHATVNKFVVGDTIDVAGATSATLEPDNTTLDISGSSGSLGSIKFGQSYAGKNFFVNSSTGSVTTDLACFAAGTRILTATGERMVESLLQGDIALTLANGELDARPVKWIGRRRIDLTAHPRPETVAPIRIRRGAFAEAMPHTDLLVSPDHAVFVDGKLICARQLINGTTIYQEKTWTSVEYFHVELDTHAILLAEGLPAESYLNTGNRGFFANSGEPLVLHPDLTDETDYPTREAGSCAPFVWDEASVRPVWQRLSERATALGQPVRPAATTSDPALHLIAAGRSIKPIYADAGLFIFPLPRNAGAVRLVSRASAPTDARPWLDDRRRLGVRLARIVLRDATEVRQIPVDHPDLQQGWWAVERDGTLMGRWTDGDAVLPLPALHGVTMLELHLHGTLDYVVSDESGRQAA